MRKRSRAAARRAELVARRVERARAPRAPAPRRTSLRAAARAPPAPTRAAARRRGAPPRRAAASAFSSATAGGSRSVGLDAVDELADRALLDRVLAERRQHVRDVLHERAVRPDDEHAAPLRAARAACRGATTRGAGRRRSCRCPGRPGSRAALSGSCVIRRYWSAWIVATMSRMCVSRFRSSSSSRKSPTRRAVERSSRRAPRRRCRAAGGRRCGSGGGA